MSGFTVQKTRIFAGIWEGMVEAAEPVEASAPDLSVTHPRRCIQTLKVCAQHSYISVPGMTMSSTK